MTQTIKLRVQDRIVSLASDNTLLRYVTGTEYTVQISSADAEWTPVSDTLYARVFSGGRFYDVPATSWTTSQGVHTAVFSIQMPLGVAECDIGMYVGTTSTTNGARLKLDRAITDHSDAVQVEFIGDLWDSFADNMSVLMADQTYDPESVKPQSGVAIAQLDSGLVHKAGTETITGIKSFHERVTLFKEIEQASQLDYMNTGFRNQSKVFDMKDGQYSMMAHQFYYKGGNQADNEYVSKAVRIYKVDRSGFQGYEWRTYNDGILPLVTQPIYRVDGNGNPLAISAMGLETSGQIAIDPRLVHTTGTETVAGAKTFTGTVDSYPGGWHITSKSMNMGQYCVFAYLNAANLGPGHFHILDFVQSSNTATAYGRMVVRADKTAPNAMWTYRKSRGSNNPIAASDIVVLASDTTLYLAWKKSAPYGNLMCREVMDINYGTVQTLGGASNFQFYAQNDMAVLDNLNGYTVYDVIDTTIDVERLASDTSIVHTTGNERITGSKTFEDGINIGRSFLVTNKTFNGYDYQTNFRRGVWEWYDKKDGADSMIASDTVSGQYQQGYNMREFKIYNLSRSTAYGLSILAYADHCAVLTNPYYPVDGSGNPQALTANALMASGNIAVDPRIVHTTGAEMVAGNKTFSQTIRFNGAVECFNVGRKGYVYPSDANVRYEIARTASDISDFYADVTVQNTAMEWFSARLYVNDTAMKAIANGKKVGAVSLTIGTCVDPTTGEHIIWFKSNGRNNHLATIQAYNRFGGAIPVTMSAQLSTYTPASEPTIEASVIGEN